MNHPPARLPAQDDLLTLWERGVDRLPAARALVLLASDGDDDISAVSVGARDIALLRLYANGFGEQLEGMAACPACGQEVDVAVPVNDLLDGVEGHAVPGGRGLQLDGYTVRFRLPTAGDLAEIASHATTPPDDDLDSVVDALLARCVEECTHQGTAADPAAMPLAVREALETAMADADPGAEIDLVLRCPDCGHRWSQLLDPLPFVWREVEGAAMRLAEDVHAIASAYTWSEQDILAMSARRRRLYLDVVAT